MEFTPYDAAQYRALEREALEERVSQLADMFDAEELPDGVTVESLIAEQEVATAEVNRRNAQAKLRNAKLAAVQTGAGKVIASSEPAQAPQAPQARESHTFRDTAEHYTDTGEYRKYLIDHLTRRAPMPREVQIRANQDITTSINGDFTSVGDFTNVLSTKIAFPHSWMGGLIKKLDEYGQLFAKAQKLSLQGGVSYMEYELEFEGHWINDTETSPYQEEGDPTAITFKWNQLEVRTSRTMLASALMVPAIKDEVPEALAKAMVKAIEQSMINGNGNTQMLGVTVDPRLVGVGGKATVIDVTAADVDDWKFWRTLLYDTSKFGRLYRDKGEWTFGDSTWGLHIDVLHDDNNRPLGDMKVLNDESVYKLRGRNVNLVDDQLLPSFDAANDGDVIGIFGNWNNYVINTQPGMPMSTVRWDDYETNTEKTRVITALDGRPVNPYGWAILKKKASA